MKKNDKYCSLFFLLIVFSLTSNAQTPFTLSDSKVAYQLDSHVEVFIDSLGATSFEKIQQPQFQHHFHPSGKKSLTFGYLEKPIWIKVSLSNSSTKGTWYLEIPAPYLEFVEFYQQTNDHWQKTTGGYYLPHSQRGVSHTGFAFPLQFNANSTNTAFLKISGNSPKNIPIFAIEKERFNEKVRVEDVGYGMFFGVMIVMILYNLVIFITLRDLNYLIYVFMIASSLSIFSAASGYGGKYLWPNHPMINFYAGRFSLGIMAILISVFSRRFLETKRYSKVVDTMLAAIIPVSIVAIILVSTKLVSSAGNNLLSVATPLFLISGIVCWVKGNKNASYFVAAWAVYLVGGLSLTLRNSGYLNYNFWTTHLAEIGAACETFLIALALSNRYTQLKKGNEEAQNAFIDQLQRNQLLQQKATVDLEDKVQERTKEIKAQNAKLSRLNLLKDKLFSILSHDIKSPLSQLSGALYLVERDMITKEEIKEIMPRIRGDLANNETFLNELLEWAKSQLDGRRISPTETNLQEHIDSVITLLLPQADAKKIKLLNLVQQSAFVFVDIDMIKSVIRNLIANAIKFTDTFGKVEIFISINDRFTTVSIKDNGRGIKEKDRLNLFSTQIFTTRGTANEKGTGIGLLICRDFVENNGGTIWVESEEEKGSIFSFTVLNVSHATELVNQSVANASEIR